MVKNLSPLHTSQKRHLVCSEALPFLGAEETDGSKDIRSASLPIPLGVTQEKLVDKLGFEMEIICLPSCLALLGSL